MKVFELKGKTNTFNPVSVGAESVRHQISKPELKIIPRLSLNKMTEQYKIQFICMLAPRRRLVNFKADVLQVFYL